MTDPYTTGVIHGALMLAAVDIIMEFIGLNEHARKTGEKAAEKISQVFR